ncbi:unnamed protein product, partial [Rotaria sp. Silwood1]
KTNGYHIPNYDKLHSKFLRQSEQAKRMRTPTKCKPFLLYTNLIPTKKDKILDNIRYEEEMRHLQTFQIKGKQLPTKSASGTSLSTSLQQSEAIPTKTTQAQRVREVIGKKKRREEETRKIRQSIRQNEDDYARKLDAMDGRVARRPLLLEQNQRDKAIRDLERKIQHAMNVANITEKDLMRQKFNPPNVRVTTTRTDYSS